MSASHALAALANEAREMSHRISAVATAPDTFAPMRRALNMRGVLLDADTVPVPNWRRNVWNLRQRAKVQLNAARYYRATDDRDAMLANVAAARENWRLARYIENDNR